MKARSVAALLIALSLLVGMTSRLAAGQEGLDLRIGVLGYYDNFNPFIAEGGASRAVIDKIYEPLVRLEPGGGVRQALASYYLNNYSSWLFKIAEGALWHDGRRVTAMDVVYTLNTILDPANRDKLDRTGLARIVKSVEAVDEDTVRITVVEPTADLFRALADIYIVPYHIFSSVDPLQYANPEPIGSGPFRYASRPSQREVELLPFEGYREEIREISRLSILSYSSLESLIDDLVSGKVDVLGGFYAGPWDLKRLMNRGISIISRSGERLTVIFFNTNNRPTDNLYFRRAVLEALDIRAIVRRGGPAVEAVGFSLLSSKHGLPPQMAQTQIRPPNSTLAIELIERAGLSLGLGGWRTYGVGEEVVVRVVAPADGALAWIAEQVANTLESLRVRAALTLLGEEELGRVISEGSYDVLVVELYYPDDVVTLYREYLTSGGRFNLARYLDDVVDNYLLYIRNATTTADIQLLGELIARRLRDYVPLIPLYSEQRYSAYRSDRIILLEDNDPSSIYSLMKLRNVMRVETITQTITTTMITTVTSTITEFSTITTTSTVTTEEAPSWVYVAYTGAAMMLLGVIVVMMIIGLVSYTSRKREVIREAR